MADIILDGGLDLMSARPAALPGTIRRCMNYEVGWRRGYTRIDGFERFDGNISPSSTTGWIFKVLDGDITGDFLQFPPEPERLRWDRIDGGVPLSGESGFVSHINIIDGYHEFFVTFRSGKERPAAGDTITGETTGAYFNVDDIYDFASFEDHYDTHDRYAAELGFSALFLRQEVRPVPGGGTIVGIHFHEDQLYAIRDVLQATVTPGQEDVLEVGMYVYNAAGQVGEVLRSDPETGVVSIAATSNLGFELSDGETISVALAVRFTDGDGSFVKEDNVLGATSGWAGEVGFIDRRDGAWDNAGALGTAAFIEGDDAPPTVGETFNNTTDGTSSLTVETVLFYHDADAVTLATIYTTSELATLWRSTDTGWEAATSTRVLEFDTGTTDPSTLTVLDITHTKAPQDQDQSSYTSSLDWNGTLSDIEVEDGSYIDCQPYLQFSGLVHKKYPSQYLTINNFGLSVLDDDTVLGVEMEIVSRNAELTTSGCYFEVYRLNDPYNYLYTTGCTKGAAFAVTKVGSPTSHWNTTLTPAMLNDPSFGFRLRAVSGTTVAADCEIDQIRIKVYTQRDPSGQIHLYDPNNSVDIGTINISKSAVESGEWGGVVPDPGLAVGYFHLSDWSTPVIPVGTELYASPGGAGNLIAITTSGLSIPALPGSKLLAANNSKYQIISNNFYASEEQNAIWGVSGAGQAFTYDGSTLDFIRTGVDEDKDLPRHIAAHENRLALGYKWGEVYLSGVDPTDFDAATGLAASFGFGDKITGLMPAAGKALGVFTESSTNVLLGAPLGWGEDPLQHVEQQVINHKIGAIEYTVKSMGERPIFATFRGIETLETMDQYSDFFTAPLSDKVSSWLLERLQTTAGVEATDRSVVNSVVVRHKNQYRLFFADGWLLTLTFVGPDKDPQLTTQKYWFNSDEDQYFRCYATASGTTTDGRDRVFATIEPRPLTPESTAPPTGAELDYVYELDRGRSFDGNFINAYFDLTYYFASAHEGQAAISRNKKFNCFQIHGSCAGYANLYMARSVNYEDLDDPVLPYESIPFYHPDMPPESHQSAKYTKGRFTARGFAVSIHIKETLNKSWFPHTIQMISFVDDDELKQNR